MKFKKEDIKKVVLAYSGGLDTSIIIPWLKENYNNCEIIAVAGNVGQADELDGLEEKALKTGASKLYILDLTDEDADEFRRQAEAFSVTRLMTILDLYMNAENEMRFSSSPRLTLENVCLKCCIRTRETDAQALNDRIEELERKIAALSEQIAGGIAVQPLPAAKTSGAAPAGAGTKKESREKKPSAPKQTDSGKENTAPAADLQSAWKEVMNRLSKEDPRIWGLLTQGKINSTADQI